MRQIRDTYMKKLLKSRKGVSNVISTLILFTVMVSSLGLALAQIIPAIENFQTQSNLTAATNFSLTTILDLPF